MMPFSLRQPLQAAILGKLRQLQEHGLDAHLDIKRLVGSQNYRLRVGKNRVVFYVRGDIIIVAAVGPRGNVYKP